jgi:hypothetical protein
MKSIVSYPDRGQGGNNKYRGNCSPLLLEDLFLQFKPKQISDYMVGGGTTEDVAKKMGIHSNCYDLNRGFDLMTMDIPERPENIFWHPPYADIVTYSDVMYKAGDIIQAYGFDPRKSDLSRIEKWDDFVKALNYCMMKQFVALQKGGRMAVLVGDIKKKGKLYSMIFELVKPGTLENVVVKAQHNCWSDGVHYSGKPFIPIVHEYMLIIRKDAPLIFEVQQTKKRMVDVRELKNATWRDIVAAVIEDLGGEAPLSKIYEAVLSFKRAEDYPTIEEKIRQTVRINPKTFISVSRGVYALAS